MGAKKVIEAIKRHSRFIISSHINLEGDALGSELALAALLRKLGKKVYIVNQDESPKIYSFLPGIKNIYRRLGRLRAQAVFIVDCPSRQRTGKIERLIKKDLPIINIDHHIGNKRFGRVNWVDHHSSSTGEMIYRLFKASRRQLDKKDALNIYTAILTDTGSFRHANTTIASLAIASELLKFGLNPAEIYSRIYENNSLQDALVVSKIISRLCFAQEEKIAWVGLNQENFKRIKSKPEILDKILDFAKAIDTVKVVVVFSKVHKHSLKLSLRSKSPIEVHTLAKSFGGGGHKFASGCTIKGTFKEVKRKVLRQIKKLLTQH